MLASNLVAEHFGKGKAYENLRTIKTFCDILQLVSAADADLMQTPTVLDWFSRMCEKPIRITVHKSRPLKRKMLIYKDVNDVIRVAQESLLEFDKLVDKTNELGVWFVTAKKEGDYGV